MERQLNEELIRQFKAYLLCEEPSAATVEKYLRDLRVFYGFALNFQRDHRLEVVPLYL